jgi:L-ascorbate metabolism protein UlaG (beta-lactamase superfamily)
MRRLLAALALLCAAAPALAQTGGPKPAPGGRAAEMARSECLAMAGPRIGPRVTPVALRRTAGRAEEVTITYAGHSTYYIDTPGGITIATDFSGAYTAGGRLPDVVTMNRAHSTHYSLSPDPRIKHVLHGWGEDGKPADIAERVGDVFIRNVPTDIRRYYSYDANAEMIRDGNSIFIFEVAGLCIGHLGHLHHQLDDSHFAAIGRIDILMVPIDGTYTMSLNGISDITKRLRSSVVLPMHRFGTPLEEFMRQVGQNFIIDQRPGRSIRMSRDTLPAAPTVIILDGV